MLNGFVVPVWTALATTISFGVLVARLPAFFLLLYNFRLGLLYNIPFISLLPYSNDFFIYSKQFGNSAVCNAPAMVQPNLMCFIAIRISYPRHYIITHLRMLKKHGHMYKIY